MLPPLCLLRSTNDAANVLPCSTCANLNELRQFRRQEAMVPRPGFYETPLDLPTLAVGGSEPGNPHL